MSAELRKLRVLPLPRVLLAVNVVVIGLTALGLTIDSPMHEEDYRDAAGIAAALTTSISAIVLGVWMVGLEYGEGAMRRVLTAEPRRLRALRTKLMLLVVCVITLTVVMFTLSWALAAAAAAVNGVGLEPGSIAENGAATLIGNFAYAVIALAIALLTRSMAGGVAVTLVLALVVDSILASIPAVGDYTFGASISDLLGSITGEDDAEQPLRGALVAAAWLLVLSTVAWSRFAREDVR